MKAALSTCPFCSSGCGLYLLRGDGGLLGVAPSETHPVSQGRLCARGWCAHEAPSWGERLETPLVRRGTRLEATSWDEALERTRSGLRELTEAGRPVGVLGSARATNEESYLLARLARAGLETPHVDSFLRSTYQPLVDGIADVGGLDAVRGTLEDLERCEVVLVVEGDLARSHPRVAFSVMRAVKNGARLATLGFVHTALGRLATLDLPLVPFREPEAAFRLAAAGRAASRDGATLDDLLTEEAWRERLTAWSPSEAEGRVAEWFSGARRAAVLVAPLGLPAGEARAFARALALFFALTGHLGRPGSVMLPLPALGNLRGACEMGVAPDRFPGGWPLESAEERARLRSLWRTAPCADEGADAAEMLGRVSGLLAFEDETAAAAPLARAALESMKALPFLVALDAFMTPTVRLAHVALPIAAPQEAEGSVTSLEGRAQEWRPGTTSPGLARPGWRVLSDLGGLLGLPTPYHSLLDVRQEMAVAVRSRVEPRRPSWTGFAPSSLVADGGAVLVRDGVYDWGSDPLVTGSPTLRRDPAARLRKYPGGCVEISPEDAEQLGLRAGSRLRLAVTEGEAVAPVAVRSDVRPGTVLVPFPFRDQLAGLLGVRGRTEVRLSRA